LSDPITDSSPLVPEVYVEIYLDRTSGFLIQQVSRKSNRGDPRMSFKQLADETFAEAWERYHGFMTDLPTTGMKIGNSPRDSTVGCHKKLRSR
jgi:hypothetical protein